MSVGEYVTITKIEAAKNMLSSGYSVAAISEKCGFSSPSYFIKAFFRVMGMTPPKNISFAFCKNVKNNNLVNKTLQKV